MSKKTVAAPELAAPSEPPGDPVTRFESSLKELDEIVARMERGDLPLEESLRLFERGVALTRECREALATAELRVKNLLAPEADAGAE
ncbi:MAG: xseB [Nevskia sp.]|nr:xseB [Nevskia sp.]